MELYEGSSCIVVVVHHHLEGLRPRWNCSKESIVNTVGIAGDSGMYFTSCGLCPVHTLDIAIQSLAPARS